MLICVGISWRYYKTKQSTCQNGAKTRVESVERLSPTRMDDSVLSKKKRTPLVTVKKVLAYLVYLRDKFILSFSCLSLLFKILNKEQGKCRDKPKTSAARQQMEEENIYNTISDKNIFQFG